MERAMWIAALASFLLFVIWGSVNPIETKMKTQIMSFINKSKFMLAYLRYKIELTFL